MGLSVFHFSKCSCDTGAAKTVPSTKREAPTKRPLPNPDPKNFSIVRAIQVNDWCVAELRYPDATNYEGRKIMLYRTTVSYLRSQHFLDPHFCDGPEHVSPFARFEPTDAGWNAAVLLAQMLR